MRGYTRRRPRRPEDPSLTDSERETLKTLLADVPEDAEEESDALVTLLEFWRTIPWSRWPVTVPAYRARGGVWLIASVPDVLDAVKSAVEAD